MNRPIEFTQSETEKIISDKIDQIFSQPLKRNYLEYLAGKHLYIFITKLHDDDKNFRVCIETDLHTQYIDNLKFVRTEYKTSDNTILKPAEIIDNLKNKKCAIIIQINSLTVCLARESDNVDNLDNNKISVRYGVELSHDDNFSVDTVKYIPLRLNHMITNPII